MMFLKRLKLESAFGFTSPIFRSSRSCNPVLGRAQVWAGDMPLGYLNKAGSIIAFWKSAKVCRFATWTTLIQILPSEFQRILSLLHRKVA